MRRPGRTPQGGFCWWWRLPSFRIGRIHNSIRTASVTELMDSLSPKSPPQVHLPLSTEGVAYFVDEAGSKGSLGKHFVTAAVRTTDPDKLSRAIKACRDRNSFTKAEEIKFSKGTKSSEPILAELFSEAVSAGCTFGAFVLDKRHFDPWSNRDQWQGHASGCVQ